MSRIVQADWIQSACKHNAVPQTRILIEREPHGRARVHDAGPDMKHQHHATQISCSSWSKAGQFVPFGCTGVPRKGPSLNSPMASCGAEVSLVCWSADAFGKSMNSPSLGSAVVSCSTGMAGCMMGLWMNGL